MAIPRLQDFRADRATYVAGDVASISVSFDQAVTVDTFGGFRVPVLVLSNGARAYYSGGSGSDELRFQYNVLDTDRSSLDLKVVAFAENDATIRNSAGEDADVTVHFNTVGSLSANNDILTPSELSGGEIDKFVTVQTQSLSTGADLVNPKIASMSSVAGTYGVGTTLDIVVSFDEVVLVRTSGGVPTLQFAGGGNVLDGFAASYVGGSGTKRLTFRVEISEGMPTASSLDVLNLSLNGGVISDLSGNNANLTITAGTNNLAPYADIQVVGSSSSTGGGETQPGGDGSADVTAAVIESVQSIKGDGPFDVGDRVDLKVTLSEAVTLNTLLGSPVLALSNGGTAQYVSGSGTRELLFRYTVKASDRNSQDLDVIGVAENDASIVDAAGNRTDVRITTDNRLAKFGNVVIDAQAPYLRSVDAADDTYIVGDTITFTGTFSEAVSVTGTPGLNLSNGGVAQYVSGSGSSLLVFQYDVAGSSQSSADLDVLSLNVADGAFKSAVTGNAATVQVTPGILSFDADVLIDTSRPSGTISLDKTSLIANETASVTVSFGEPVADPRSAISVLNGTLSDLVTAETGDTGRVWTGTFTPALGVEDATNVLILDNTKVFDDAGNAGIGLAASANFLIDTRGPSPVVSSVAQADGSRVLTLDFGEPVTDLSESGLVVTNGIKGDLSKLSDSKYSLVVTPEASNPSGVIGLSLVDNHIKDALGNFNDPFTASFVWDETSPVIEEITSPPKGDGSFSYTTNDAIDIRVRFSEPVEVSPVFGDASLNPVLALSNGRVAAYQGGSGTNTLTFRYIVQSGDEASDLDSLALIENASRIHDASGNDAQVRITSGLNNLAFVTNIVIDGVVPSITNVSAADGLYQAGDDILLDVQFSEDVVLDRTGGDPILALSNGSYASFVSHDGDRMVFSYAVTTGDNDAQDLDVLGFAENGSALVDASGNRANVAIRFGINNLAERNEVNIDAARPQIAETSANAGEYKAGQQIEIALAMSKGVVVDTTQGDPSLRLNNGREAIFDAEASTPTKLVFVYDVLATDVREDTDTGTLYEEYDLSIASFEYNNAEIRSLIGGADALMMLPLSGLASEAVHVDLTLPEVVSISLSDMALAAGEDADVTVVLSEPVRQLDVSYFSVQHGSLSAFTTTDNVTWHAVYTPVRAVEASDLVISLDAARLSDAAGNLGSGVAQSAAYSLDSTYPEIEIRSDTAGVARGDVRFIVNFSEAVTGFTVEDLKVINGTIVPFSFDGPNAEGEYSVMVSPLAGSRQPIKVSVGVGAAADEAGNESRASSVFVQPVDTDAPRIEKIAGVKGSYALGDTISIDVTFTEAVTLQLEPELSEHVLPHLSLNNGQEAIYVAGSGGKTWTFEYVVSTPEDVTQLVDRETLKVLALVENDTSLLDAAGNKLEDYFVETDAQLNAGLSVDTTGAVITGFSSVDGTYKTDDVLYIRAHLSELVHVQGTPAPYLMLSNGGRATYLSGTGSSQLMFRYIVDEADGNASDLSVVSFNAPAAGIVDRAGNVTDLSIVAGENDLAAAHQIVVDTQAPELTGVRLVEDAGTASDVVNDGYYKAGTVLAFEVDFDDAVSVDVTNGTPILTLSNGSIAQYVGHVQNDVDGQMVDDPTKLRFEYTVQQDDINTQLLKVTGLAERGAKITDQAGNRAYVEVNDGQLNYTTAVVDTIAPTQDGSSDSFTANERGDDLARTPQTITVTFSSNEVIGVDYSSIDYDALNALTRGDLGLEADAAQEDLDAAIVQSIYAAEQAVALSGITVTFAGSRADENGFALTDLDGDLSATNYRLVANEQGVVDGTAFAVDVDVPDRAMGTLTVSAVPGALEDLALNANADVFSHDQAVDTQTVDFEITPAAGLFIGSTSEVKIYDSIGDALSAAYLLDPETGQARISVAPSAAYPNGYRGPVLVEVVDRDPNPDYIDEFTGQGVSLSNGTSSYSMRAVFNVVEPGEIPVTVSPVTELSVRKLFEAATPSAATPLDPAKVDQFNSGIAKIFGLSEIVHTKATVINSALIEETTGVDVDDFDLTDGASASEKYGQVLAMLSARDSQSGSLAATVDELAATIKAIPQAGQTTLAITQLGADRLAAALDSSALDSDLDGAGINRELLDVAYIDEASAAGYGLNLAEAETTDVPVKGAEVGDTVFVQWGVIARPDTDDVLGAPNRFSVVIDASHVQADGSIRVPVPLSVIEKQGDANEVAVSTAVLPAGSVDGDGNPVTTPAESDYRAPVLLTVDIIPPQTTVQAPDPLAPFVTLGDVEGIRSGDELTVLLNNSADEHFKYVLSTEFFNDYAEAISGGATASSALALVADQIPTGLTVSNIVQDAASGTWAFDWSLDLTQAISVAEQTAEAEAIAAGEDYTPSATFTVDDERSVFQVQASTADLVGNADADDARNEVIIGSVVDLVDTPEEQSAMDQALNRLSARYGDAAVDTRAEIKTLADAIDGVTALKNSGDPAATSGDLVAAAQTLVMGSGGAANTPGAVAAGVHTLSIGDQTFSVDLSNSPSPTVADVIDDIVGSEGYADLPYKVGLDASGNGLAISWKAFGPQPAASSDVAVTSTQSATQLTSTISNSGSLASFASQSIAVDGETVDGGFVPATGDVTVAFGGTALTVTVSEGDSMADVLAGLQGDGDYDSLPFRLGVNQAGDGLVATWKATQATPVTDHITVDRDFEVTTTTEITATIVAAGSAGVTTQELTALDIANVDDSELAAINRALASDLAAVSAPVVSFADSILAAGESTTVSLTFSKRLGQVPDDVMSLVGGELSSEGSVGDPIWSTTDGLTWTATFTATSDIPNTTLRYAERVDADGVVVDGNGNAVLDPVVFDDTTTPVTYGQAGDNLSQIALTEALVNRVTDAASKVAAFADSQGDVPAASPSVQDFADMAVSGVRDDNLSAVQDALGAIRDRFEGEGDLYTQIQTVTDSYNAVFNTVYTPGATDQPSSADLVEDLINLGVGNLSADSARAADQMTLLQGALRAVAAAKVNITNDDSTVITAAEQQADMINSVAKLESFVASVEKVLARASGDTVDVGGTPTRVAVAAEDLSALGFEGLLADTSSNSRLSSLQKVIADQSEGTGSTGSAGIVDYADLKAVLETAADAFDDIVALTAAAQDSSYMDPADRTQAVTVALANIDADSFRQMGVDGVTDVAIGTLSAAAMADAVKDALSNTDNAINSLESIQQVVDSYRQVLSVASGDVTGDQAIITKDQLSDLGVSLSEDDAQEQASLATLLSGIIANKAAPAGGATTDNVNSVADIQALADAAKKVFDNANQPADDGGANASQADLNVLGFDGVDADNLDAIQRVLTRTDGRDGVTSYADLKAKVDAAVDAHTALTAVVSTAQSSIAPDLTGLNADTFSDMGIDGVDAGNYAAMLDALSNTGNTVDTAAAVQTVVDSYNVLLDLGAYSASSGEMRPAPATATDLINIGITLESGTEDAVAELATGILASLTEEAANSVAEAQAIVDAIDSVFANTLRSGEDDTTHTTVVVKEELEVLGFTGVTDDNLDAIQRVLSDQAGVADVKDYADLKQLVDAAITAHSDILTAATTDDLTGIDGADYAAMGVDGVDTDNLGSINDALIKSPNTLTTAASVQNVVDSYNHILDLRDGDANGGNSSITLDVGDFTDLGVTLKAAGAEQDKQMVYLQELVANNGGPSVASVADIQSLADATSDLIDLIQGTSPDSDSTDGLTIDQWALLGITTDADEVGTLNARLALTADNLSEVTNLTTALADRVQEARDAMAKIEAYANADGVSVDVPTVQDYSFIGVTQFAITETLGGSGWNVSAGTDAAGDLLSRLTGSSGVTFFYDENNTLIRSSGTLTKLQIVEEAADHIEFYVYGELNTTINNTSNAAPNGPYYGWQHLRFERDADGVISRTLPPTAGVGGSLTEYSFLDDPAYVGITGDLSALGTQDPDVNHGSGAFFGLNTGTVNYLASENALYVEPVVQTSYISIDDTNLSAINELFAASGVGVDLGDDPATNRSEVQYVIDQNVGRLGALAKIANYADNNGVDLVTYPAPDAADFAAAGVSGVADNNNIPALLVKLKSQGSTTNYAATNTAAELQAFVKTVAIEKIANWADSDGGNGAAPILQDYLNAGLVNYDDSPINAAIVPALNELFAGSLTNAGDADDYTEQQSVIDGAATMLAALTRIGNYAEADGAIDLDGDANTGDANGYDHLTVADFEAAGISGVADGTYLSVGTGTSTAASGYNNLDAVLAKLAESGVKYLNADTVDKVQQLVSDVAVEKINAYADANGVLPLVNETISVYVDTKTGGGNAFYLDGVEAPVIELKAGTYTFDQSDSTNDGHPLNVYANADRSGTLPAGITVTQTGTPGSDGAQTVVVVDETFSGTVSYQCATHDGMGNSAEVEPPYFTPELQDYTNAGLKGPNDSTIMAEQVEDINNLFAAVDTGGVFGTDTYHADDATNQQAIIDAGSGPLLAIQKIAAYAGTNVLTPSDTSLIPTYQDYQAVGLNVTDANVAARFNTFLVGTGADTTQAALNTAAKIRAYANWVVIADAANNDTAGTTSNLLNAPLGAAAYESVGVVGTTNQAVGIVNSVMDASSVGSAQLATVTDLQSYVDDVKSLIKIYELGGKNTADNALLDKLAITTGTNYSEAVKAIAEGAMRKAGTATLSTITDIGSYYAAGKKALEAPSTLIAADLVKLGFTSGDMIDANGVPTFNITNAALSALKELLDGDAATITDYDHFATYVMDVTRSSNFVAGSAQGLTSEIANETDYATLGLTNINSESASRLANGILKYLNESATLESYSSIADAASVVPALATTIALAEGDFANSSLGIGDLAKLGFKTTGTLIDSGAVTALINSSNLNFAIKTIARADVEADYVPNFTKLKLEVNEKVTAYNKVMNYFSSATLPTDSSLIPTIDDLKVMGVTGIDSTLLPGVLASGRLTNAHTDSNGLDGALAAIRDVYLEIRDIANGVDDLNTSGENASAELVGKISAAELDTIGINVKALNSDGGAQIASIVSDFMDGRDFSTLNNPTAIQGLHDGVANLMSMAGNGNNVTSSDLDLLMPGVVDPLFGVGLVGLSNTTGTTSLDGYVKQVGQSGAKAHNWGTSDARWDDGSFRLDLPFDFNFANQAYKWLGVSTNSALFFEVNDDTYQNLSADNPAIPKFFLGAADNSVRWVYTKTTDDYVAIRWEGFNDWNEQSKSTQNAPELIWEVRIMNPASVDGKMIIEFMTGNFTTRSGAVTGLATQSTWVKQFSSLSANTRYVFEADETGNNWTFISNTIATNATSTTSDQGVTGTLSDDVQRYYQMANTIRGNSNILNSASGDFIKQTIINGVSNGLLDDFQRAAVSSDTSSVTAPMWEAKVDEPSNINSNNLATYNSVLELEYDADALLDSAHVQNIINVVNQVVSAADGASGDALSLSADDYLSLNLVDDGSNLIQKASLMNSWLDGASAAQVDTVSKLQTVWTSIQRLLNGTSDATLTIEVADFTNLGITDVNATNLAAVRNALLQVSDLADIDTLSELSTLAADVATSYQAFIDGVAANDFSVITEQFLSNLGLTVTSSDEFTYFNSVINHTDFDSTRINTFEKLKTEYEIIANTIRFVNGVSGSYQPSSDQLQGQHVIGADSSQKAFYLLSYLDAQTDSSTVDTLAKLNAVAEVIDQLGRMTDNQSYSLSINDFATLGVSITGNAIDSGAATANLTASNVDWVIAAIYQYETNYATISSYPNLLEVVDASALSANKILGYLNGYLTDLPAAGDLHAFGISSTDLYGNDAVQSIMDMLSTHRSLQSTQTIDQVQSAVSDWSAEVSSIYQALITDRTDRASSDVDEAIERQELHDIVIDLVGVSNMASYSDYAAQTDLSLTAENLNKLLGGEMLSAADIQYVVERLIGTPEQISDYATLKQLLVDPAYMALSEGALDGLNIAEAIGADGNGIASLFAESGIDLKVTISDGSTSVTREITSRAAATHITLTEAEVAAFAEGNLTVTVNQVNGDNSETTLLTRTVALDNAIPSAPTLTVTDSAAVDGITNVAVVSVSNLEASASWEYSQDGGATWAAGNGTDFTVSDGDYVVGDIKARQIDAAGNVSAATAYANALTVDTLAPTLTVSSTTVENTGSISIQSNEVGTAYLVKNDVSVTDLASITNAADAKWNSVAISAADTLTSLSASGLEAGTYKLYTFDTAGNISAAATAVVTEPVPPVEIAMFQAQGDQTYYVGDEVQIVAIPTVPLVYDSNVGLELTLNNGGKVEMSTSTRTIPGGQTYTLLTGLYTVTEDIGKDSDYIFPDLQVTAVSGVSGKPLPYSTSGQMDISVDLNNVNLPLDIDLSNYVPPRFETLVFEEDTGLFANDLVTSQEYQFDGTNGAMSGTFSPELANNAEFFATIGGRGQTIVDADNSPRNELVTFTDASALGTFETQAELGQYLSYSNSLTFSPKDGATLAAGTYTVSISFDGNTYTGSVTTNADTTGDDNLRTVLSNLLDSFAAGASNNPYENGFKRFGTIDGQEVTRFDGQGFTVTFQQAAFASSFELVETVANSQTGAMEETRTPITANSAITADNGSSEVSNGYLSTSIERGILATIDQTGSSVSGSTSDEIQRITLIAEPDSASVHAVIRLGTESIEIAYGTSDWDVVITSLNTSLATLFDASVRPVAALVSGSNTVLTAGSSVDVTFTWTDQTPGYTIAKQDLEAVEVFSSGFNYTLDKTAATTPIVSTGVSNAGSDVSSSISGVTAGEYIYLIKNDQTTVLNNLSSAPQTALDNLRDLSDELWSRSKVASDGSVDLTTVGLVDGTYSVVAMDLAGNFSTVATNTIEVTGSSYASSDALFDAIFEGIDFDGGGIDTSDTSATATPAASGDNTAVVYIETSDMAVDDTVELFADGLLVYSNKMTESDITAGKIQTDEINFATQADDLAAGSGNTAIQNDDQVILELKVKHGDQYVQDSADVTWVYQW